MKKFKVWVKYTEGYLPTPRHRNLRYKECEGMEDVTIIETAKDQTELKYKVGNIKVREYNGRLYKQVNKHRNLFYVGNDERNKDNDTILGRLKHSFIGYSSYFGFDPEDTKEKMMQKAQKEADNYIFIDGDLWEITFKPSYNLLTFGCGNNHAGIGTSISVVHGERNNGHRYEAHERDEAIEEALKVAIRRGDTNSIDYIKNCPVIEVF